MKKANGGRRFIRIIYISFFIQIIIIFSMNNFVQASDGDNLLNDIENGTDDWIAMGQNQMNNVGITVSEVLNPVLGIAQVLTFIGFWASVIGVLIVAKDWLISSNSSPEKLQEAKHKTFGLLVSAVVCLGAYGIWKLLINNLSQL